MIVREFSATDVELAVPLFIAVFDEPPWNDGWTKSAATERLRRFIEAPGGFGVIAFEEATPIGFALGFLEQWTDGEEFLLKEMCVRNGKQRKGIGQSIAGELHKRLAKKGCLRVLLQTLPGSSAASFYEKCGYEPIVLSTMSKRLAPPNQQ